MAVFDYMSVFNTPEKRLAATRTALRATGAGIRKLIRVDLVDGKIKFSIPALGPNAVFNDHISASQQLATVKLNEAVTFEPGFKPYLGGQYNQAADVLDTIRQRIRGLSPEKINLLKQYGIPITDSNLDNLALDLLTFQGSKNEIGEIKKFLNEKLNKVDDVFTGAASVSDDGVRLLRFRAGEQSLTNMQVQILRAAVGMQTLNLDTLDSVFSKVLSKSGDVGIAREKYVEKFFGALGKVPKRERGVFGARDVGLVDDLISKFVDTGLVASGANPNVLVLDPQYDFLARMAGIDPSVRDHNEKIRKAKRQFYKDKTVEDVFGDYIDELAKSEGTDRTAIYGDLSNAIRDFHQSQEYKAYKGTWKSDVLKDYLLDNFAKGNEGRKNMVHSVYSSIEYAFDGTALVNSKNINFLIGNAKKQMADLLSRISSETDNTVKGQMQLEYQELNNFIKNLQNNKLYQVTLRGFLEGLGTLKSSFTSQNFEKALKGFAAVISKSDIKPDVSTQARNAVALSGLGDSATRVYGDAIAEAFHPDIFLNDETLAHIEQFGLRKLQEFEDAVENNQIPSRIIKQAEKVLAEDINLLPEAKQASALRNRQYVQEFMDLYRSGMDLRSSPRMINALHNLFAIEAFRFRDDVLQAVSPLTYRLPIASEAGFLSKPTLGKGFEKISIRSKDATVTQDLINFRVSGHKLGFSSQMTGYARVALGGYDLDDKIVMSTRMFRDADDKARLGFYITRTPSGFQESLFTRAVFDSETVRFIFGEDDIFKSTLERMAKDKSRANISNLENLHNMLLRKPKGGFTKLNSDQIEQTIIQVYEFFDKTGMKAFKPAELTERQIRRIQKSGSSPLMIKPSEAIGLSLEDIRVGYDSDIVTKIFTKPDFSKTSIIKQLEEVMSQEGAISPAARGLLSGVTDTGKALEIFIDAYRKQDLVSIETTAILNRVFEKLQLDAVMAQDYLGRYINRTTLVGAINDQFEDLLEAVGDNNISKYIKNNLGIALLESEEAIDLSISFSGKRGLANIENVAKQTGISVDRLRPIYDRIEAKAGKVGNFGLDLLGQDIVEQIGRAIGFTRNIALSDKQLRLGIDAFWLKDRLAKDDIIPFAQSILRGLNEFGEQKLEVSSIDTLKEVNDFRTSLEKVLMTKDRDEILQFLLNNIGLTSNSRYARRAMLEGKLSLLDQYFDNINRLNLNRIGREASLVAAETTKESLAIAQRIIDDHKSQFEYFRNLTSQEIRAFSENEKFIHSMRLQALGTSIYDQLYKAMEIEGQSYSNLINAYDQLTVNKMYMGLDSVRYITEGEEAKKYLQLDEMKDLVRRSRRAKYYQQFNDIAARQIMSELGDDLTFRNIRERASEAAKAIDSRPTGPTMRDLIYTILSGDSVTKFEDLSDEMREEALKQTEIIRSIFFRQEMEQEAPALFEAIERQGTVTLESLGEESDEDIRRLIEASRGGEVLEGKVAEYVRISREKIRQIFENKLAKGSAIGLAALAVGSLVYTKVRDVTSESVSGPPLLPGGSAYEEDVPMPLPSSGFQMSQMRNFSSGNSYNISINGSFDDVERFRAASAGLINGNINTTIYSSLPRMDRDVYSEMGRNF